MSNDTESDRIDLLISALRDENEALRFLKRLVYDRIAHAQTGRLKSHLDTGGDTVTRFQENSE